MLEALAWGSLASSSLLVGGVVALRVRLSSRALGLVMAFGAGVLVSAVAYELVGEALERSGGTGRTAAGLLAGSLVFFAGDVLIDRMGGETRTRVDAGPQEGVAAVMVLGIVLDGIPESTVLGLGLVEGGGVSAAVLAAVFVSNVPEAVAATAGLSRAGWTARRILGLWAAISTLLGLAALAGFAAMDDASGASVGFVLAFAGGAVLTMLADSMMPQAFEHGGRVAGVVTTIGFSLAFAISALD